MNILFPKSNINKIFMSGTVTVAEEIKGNIDIMFESSRCSLDMKTCEKYGAHTVRGMCNMITDKSPFYSNIFSKFNPSLNCPIKPNNYTLTEVEIDLTFAALLPLDGYVWLTTLRLGTGESSLNGRKIAMCFKSETRVTRPRRSRNQKIIQWLFMTNSNKTQHNYTTIKKTFKNSACFYFIK